MFVLEDGGTLPDREGFALGVCIGNGLVLFCGAIGRRNGYFHALAYFQVIAHHDGGATRERLCGS